MYHAVRTKIASRGNKWLGYSTQHAWPYSYACCTEGQLSWAMDGCIMTVMPLAHMRQTQSFID